MRVRHSLFGNLWTYHDRSGLNGTHHPTGTDTGGYSFIDYNSRYLSQSGTGGVNFYGEDLAWRSLYYRSGLTLALTMANEISGHWIRYPSFVGLVISGSPLWMGGGVLGASADYALGTGAVSINDVRPFWANPANISTATCTTWDSRDSGYLESWVSQGALYDPDTTSTDAPGGIPWRTYYRNLLSTISTNEDGCSNASGSGVDQYSWASTGSRWDNTATHSTSITLTNGSAIGTGTGLLQAITGGGAGGNSTHPNCDGVDIVTVSVTAGSANISIGDPGTSGSFTAGITDIVLDGRFYRVLRTDSTHATLAALWPGSTGLASGLTRNMTGNSSILYAFGTSFADPTLKSNYACKWNSSTQITLDRPFVKDVSHPDTDTYSMYSQVLAGYGQQPFMLGVKTYSFWQAAQLDATLSTTFQTKATEAGTWLETYGFDHPTTSINYGSVFQFCESGGAANPVTFFDSTISGCRTGYSIGNLVGSRQLNQEGMGGLIQWYLANPTSANRAIVDKFYGAIWCSSTYDDPSISASCDAYSVGNNSSYSNLTDTSLTGGKWSGQLFGVGKAHEWPAVRLGGVPPAVPQTVMATCNISSVTNATRCRVTLTKPDGSTVTNTCTTSPCAVTADARQGDHLLKVEYLSASNAVLASGEPEPVKVR